MTVSRSAAVCRGDELGLGGQFTIRLAHGEALVRQPGEVLGTGVLRFPDLYGDPGQGLEGLGRDQSLWAGCPALWLV